ncbi:MAG: hypothetical protein Q7J85_13615 [Bacillota bacterium]|nr:hypothetical protein [Bacillota bacterium]
MEAKASVPMGTEAFLIIKLSLPEEKNIKNMKGWLEKWKLPLDL